jgi:hypothetical protein
MDLVAFNFLTHCPFSSVDLFLFYHYYYSFFIFFSVMHVRLPTPHRRRCPQAGCLVRSFGFSGLVAVPVAHRSRARASDVGSLLHSADCQIVQVCSSDWSGLSVDIGSIACCGMFFQLSLQQHSWFWYQQLVDSLLLNNQNLQYLDLHGCSLISDEAIHRLLTSRDAAAHPSFSSHSAVPAPSASAASSFSVRIVKPLELVDRHGSVLRMPRPRTLTRDAEVDDAFHSSDQWWGIVFAIFLLL